MPNQNEDGSEDYLLDKTDRLLNAISVFEAADGARSTIALWAEVTTFDEKDKPAVVKFLWNYISDRINKTNSDKELTSVGSACRKMVSYLPLDKFDDLIQFLQVGNHDKDLIAHEILKGINGRCGWDETAPKAECPKLKDRIGDVINAHMISVLFPKEEETDLGTVIVLNGILSLGYLGDERVLRFVDDIIQSSKDFAKYGGGPVDPNWFVELLSNHINRSQVKHNETGLLPVIANRSKGC